MFLPWVWSGIRRPLLKASVERLGFEFRSTPLGMEEAVAEEFEPGLVVVCMPEDEFRLLQKLKNFLFEVREEPGPFEGVMFYNARSFASFPSDWNYPDGPSAAAVVTPSKPV